MKKSLRQTYPKHNVLIFGRPGSGKGTLAQTLAQEERFTHVGVGSLIRAHMDKGTPLGKRLEEELGDRLIVPDDLAKALVLPELEAVMRKGDHFALESYPVNLIQLFDFIEFIDIHATKLVVVHLDVSEQEATKRLQKRKTCPVCHGTHPPKEEECRHCEVPLIIRYDDKPEIIAQRQRLYDQVTAFVLVELGKRFPIKKFPPKTHSANP